MDGYVGSWQKPSKDDLKIIKRNNTRRFLEKYYIIRYFSIFASIG